MNPHLYRLDQSGARKCVTQIMCFLTHMWAHLSLSLCPHMLSSSIVTLFLFSHGTLSLSPVHLYLSQVKSSSNSSLSLSCMEARLCSSLLPQWQRQQEARWHANRRPSSLLRHMTPRLLLPPRRGSIFLSDGTCNTRDP
jgi:hypothetical protein